MKKILWILFLVPFSAVAQDSTGKFLIGISFSNDLCNRLSLADDEVVQMKNDFDSLESFQYGMTTGMFAGYSLRSNLTLQAGAYFANRGYKIDTLQQASIANVKFNFRYVEVPVRLNYVFRNSWKLKPFFSAGLSMSLLVQNKTFYRTIGVAGIDDYRDEQKLAPIVYGMNASIGFQKEIQEEYLFQCEVIYRQSVSSISDTPLKRYLNATGINLSLIQKF